MLIFFIPFFKKMTEKLSVIFLKKGMEKITFFAKLHLRRTSVSFLNNTFRLSSGEQIFPAVNT